MGPRQGAYRHRPENRRGNDTASVECTGRMKLPSDIVEDGWCQHAIARQANGDETHELDPDATEWCMSGAYYKWANGTASEVTTCYSLKISTITGENWGAWNDNPDRTQAEVVAVLREVEKEMGFR